MVKFGRFEGKRCSRKIYIPNVTYIIYTLSPQCDLFGGNAGSSYLFCLFKLLRGLNSG